MVYSIPVLAVFDVILPLLPVWVGLWCDNMDIFRDVCTRHQSGKGVVHVTDGLVGVDLWKFNDHVHSLVTDLYS